MSNIFIRLLVLCLASYAASAKEVVVIGTLHGDHNRFPLYTFQTLDIMLRHIAPDLILIEEDPRTFAEKKYETLSAQEYGKIRPIEIPQVIIPFAKAKGIKLIPTDWRVEYDEESKQRGQELHAMLQKPTLKQQYESLIASYESVFLDDTLTRSVYDLHSDTFMAILEQREQLFAHSPFAAVRVPWRTRQERINRNIIQALRAQSFKKAVVVYGISHRPHIIRAIKQSGVATIVDLRQAMATKLPTYFDRKGSQF